MNIKKSIKNPTILIIICVFILLLPNFFAVFEAGDLPAAQFYESIAYGVFFWILWFALWKRAWLAILFASVPALWWAGSLFVRIKYQVPITQTFLSMVLNTPTREFFDFYLSYGWSWLFIAILIPIALLSLSFYLKIHPVTWSHRSRSLTMTLGLSSIMLMYIVIDLIGPQHDIFLLGQKKDPFQADTPQLWFDRLGSVYPLDFPIAAWQVYRNKQKTQLLRDTLPDIDVEPDIESTDRPDIVVMVIGESSRLDHWGLFGYNRQTTPSLQKQSGVLAFNNIVTQSISTRVAVPSLVSRKPFLLPHGPATNSVEPSILKAFEKSGYETYWLSNQSSSGFLRTQSLLWRRQASKSTKLIIL
ncbi:MAG: sulfatase-like hydrolase/transferase [Candidatus Competibacteraceae bacterium]|nr:sulfatase-like hydrolase/transferase [Candidatus Competibacteraceae bacterium]